MLQFREYAARTRLQQEFAAGEMGFNGHLRRIKSHRLGSEKGQTATWQQVGATSALPPQSRHVLMRLARQLGPKPEVG